MCAGGLPAALDQRLLRHRLRERNVGHAPAHQVVVVFIRHRYGAIHLTLATARTGVEIDIGGLLVQVDLEGAVAIARDLIHFTVDQRRDVGVMRRGRHLGRHDAARAVERGEDLAQENRLPANAGAFLDQQHAVAHVAQRRGRLHAGHAGTDDHDIVVQIRFFSRWIQVSSTPLGTCPCAPRSCRHRPSRAQTS